MARIVITKKDKFPEWRRSSGRRICGFKSLDQVEPFGHVFGTALVTEFALDAVGGAR